MLRQDDNISTLEARKHARRKRNSTRTGCVDAGGWFPADVSLVMASCVPQWHAHRAHNKLRALIPRYPEYVIALCKSKTITTYQVILPPNSPQQRPKPNSWALALPCPRARHPMVKFVFYLVDRWLQRYPRNLVIVIEPRNGIGFMHLLTDKKILTSCVLCDCRLLHHVFRLMTATKSCVPTLFNVC